MTYLCSTAYLIYVSDNLEPEYNYYFPIVSTQLSSIEREFYALLNTCVELNICGPLWQPWELWIAPSPFNNPNKSGIAFNFGTPLANSKIAWSTLTLLFIGDLT